MAARDPRVERQLVTAPATADEVLRSVAPDMGVDRGTLARLLRCQPPVEAVLPLLSTPGTETVRAAVLYIGLHGTESECALLALCLRHRDLDVVRLAEYGLWRIWMEAGTPQANRLLAAAIYRIQKAEYTAALRVLSRLAVAEPDFAEVYFQQGIALSMLERVTEAGHAYREALRLNTYHFGAAAALGHTCVEQGNLIGALHYYRRALQIHPRLDDLPQAVQALERKLGPAAGTPYA